MKKIFIFCFTIAFISCTSVKNISYVVNISTEKSIYNEILKKRHKDIVFYIEHLSNSTIKISLIKSNDNEFFTTNRKLFVNDKLYPLIFDTDYFFYSKIKNNKPVTSFEKEKNIYKEITIPTIQVRETNPELYGYSKKTILIDNSIYWIVDRKGKLLETNSEDLLK